MRQNPLQDEIGLVQVVDAGEHHDHVGGGVAVGINADDGVAATRRPSDAVGDGGGGVAAPSERLVAGQAGVGIDGREVDEILTRNEVEDNDFILNQEQVRYVAARDEPWGAKRGNHWSNYLGWDRDGDGVGDVPYEANDVVDRLSWRHPLVKLLLASPAVQTLRLIAQQFPLLRAPSVVDRHPRMKPINEKWSDWLGKQRR